MQLNAIRTTADFMSIEGSDEFFGSVMYAGLRELPSYDYDVNSEWFWSDFKSNLSCFIDLPYEWYEMGGWDAVREFLEAPQLAEYFKLSIEDEFRKDATKFLESRDWIVEHKFSRT